MKRLALLSVAAVALMATSAANAFCLFNCTYAKTKYPIVLVHGLFGFEQIGGAVDYFYQVPSALADKGAKVYTPAVPAIDSNEVRGEQLLLEVKKILAVTGAAKVNLIGHSQGSPTARYVAGVIPGNVASVTSIAGVNKGAPMADVLLSVDSYSPALGGFIYDIVNGAGSLLNLATGEIYEANAQRSMTSLSTAGSLAFNQKFPNGIPATACGEGAYSKALPGGTQYYYSWTGNAARQTNLFDLIDPFLMLTAPAFLIAPDQNDILVGVCSSKFGRVLRTDYPWNHLDEVNQMTGLIGLGAPDPVQVIVTHANRLKNQGL
ncbi:MAG: lipase family alpha/beta hydrolase [Pseudomonadota bacterium]